QQEEQLMVHIVFTDDLAGMDAEGYAQSIVAEKGPNSAAYVVDVQGRQMGVQTGEQWPQGKLDEMYDAAYPHLAEDDWAGSANALVDAALGSERSMVRTWDARCSPASASRASRSICSKRACNTCMARALFWICERSR